MIGLYVLILIIFVIILFVIILTSSNLGSPSTLGPSSNLVSSSNIGPSTNQVSSTNQMSSTNQFLKQTNKYLLDLYESRFYNYKYHKNSCFIHSSLQLLRTFFSLLFIDKKINLDNNYINTLLNFDSFDTNRNLYFTNIDNTFMNYGQHDVSEFLSAIFINLINRIPDDIISYDGDDRDIVIKLGVDTPVITKEYLQLQLQDKNIEYKEYIIISLQGYPPINNFTFNDVTSDINIYDITYSPYSIVQYAGNGYGGHYINYSKKPNTQDLKRPWSWYKYDDITQTDAIKSDDGITGNPVVILYKKIIKK